MKAQLKEKLTTLTSLIGVSGNEHHVIRYCKDYLEPLADEVTVLPCGDLIAHPRHCYTECLLSAVPTLSGAMPSSVPGQPPSGISDEAGCAFYERCPRGRTECAVARYRFCDVGGGHCTACVPQYGGLS